MSQSHPPLLSSSSFRLIVCRPHVRRLLISVLNRCFYCPRLFRQNIQMSFKVAERSDGRLFSAISKCHCVRPWKRRACSGFLFNTSLSPLPSFRSRLCWRRRLLRRQCDTEEGRDGRSQWMVRPPPPPFAMLICDSIYRYDWQEPRALLLCGGVLWIELLLSECPLECVLLRNMPEGPAGV